MSEKSAREDLQAIDSGADFLQPVSGWVIGSRGGGVMRLEAEQNMITIAKIGEGKGTSVAIPNLLTHEGSVFSLEIGGDTYRNTFNYRKILMGQNIRVIDPFGVTGIKSDSINLLAELKKIPSLHLEVHAATFCACIYGDATHEAAKSTGDNHIFTQTASQITLAHILYLCSSPEVKESEINITHLKRLLLNFGTGHPELDLSAKFREDSGLYAGRYETAVKHLKIGKHINDDKTTYGIGFTIRSAFAFADSQLISSVSNESTFDLDELKTGKNTLYVVMPDIASYKMNATWLRLLLDRSLAAFPNTGNSGIDLRHEDRALFMLDEFTQLGYVPSLKEGFATLRQHGVTLWPMFQSIGQLEDVYGEKAVDGILGSAAVVQIFGVADKRTTEYASARLGKNFVYVPQVQHGETQGTSSQTSSSQANTSGNNRTETDGSSQSVGSTFSSSHTIGTTETVSYGPQGQTSSTSDNSSSTSSSSVTNTTGTNKSTARGINEQKTNTIGLSEGFNENRSISITFTPQLLPKLDPSQVEEVVGTGNRQIIFINTKGRVIRLIDERANYFQIPFLKYRAHGPASLDIPNFGITPKMPLMLSYQPATILNTALDFSKLRTQQPDVVLQPVDPLDKKVRIKGVSWFNIPLKKAWNELTPKRDKKGKLKDSKEVLDMKRNIFISAAPIISSASDGVRKEVREKNETADREWSRIDGSADELNKSYSELKGTSAKLEKKKRTLVAFEGVLIEYRDDLLGAHGHVESNPERISQYQRYIDAVVFLREQWVHNQKEVVIAPERPPEKETNDLARAATENNIRSAIGEEIHCKDFSIPNVPDLPKRPDRSPSPTVSVAAPDKTLATTTQELPNGEKYSLVIIDHVIAYRSKWRHRLTFTEWQDGLKVKHFKQARSTLIDKVFDHTGEVLRGCVDSQQTYGRWLADDMSKAGHYARDIRHTADKHTVVLDDMKSLEVEMDRHWVYLEGRLAGLNMAGKLIEQCSIRSFNQLAVAPEWQRLEWQNQRLLEAPKTKHGIHLASINAEKTPTDSSPTANKEAIIPSAPPARANRTTRSFQAQAADTTRRDEMSENGVVTKVNKSGVAPTPEQVAKLEADIGHKLPQDYLDLLADPKASVPVYNSFPISKGETETIEWFHPFSKLNGLYQTYDGEHEELDGFPAPTCNGSSDISGFLPIAKTHGAHLCLDVSEQRDTYGAVYCWQVSYDDLVSRFVKLTDTLPEFMQSVKNTEITEEERSKMTGVRVGGATKQELEDILNKVRIKHGFKKS